MPGVTTPRIEEECPPAVQAVMRSHPPTTCYRERERKTGHYWIRAYVESIKRSDGSPGPVRIALVHGSDSFLPGMSVQPTDPIELVACGCGEWRDATADQLYYMREHLNMLQLARSGTARPHGPESVETQAMRVRLGELHRSGCMLVSTIDAQSVAVAVTGKVRAEKIERAYNAFRMALAIYAPIAEPAERDAPFIMCTECHLKSYNPSDIATRYCGACNKFHEEDEDYELGPQP